MRLKKSDLEIGEESCGLFSDSNQTPPLNFPHKSRPHLKIQIPSLSIDSSTVFAPNHRNRPNFNNPSKSKALLSNPHRRPMNMSQNPSSLSSSPRHHHHHHHHRRRKSSQQLFHFLGCCCSSSEALLATKSIALKLFRHSHLNLFWIKIPLRVFLLFFLPFIFFFSSNHNRSLYLYVLFGIVFSTVLLLSSLNLPLPRLPSASIRLFLARTFPIKSNAASKPPPPVVWSIGSKPQLEGATNSGYLVKVYSNGDVYEGEFYKGKCSGSGVYYYNRNGRYEGDWVDQKYDGYGVETWAKGSRYRGQYRQGLRHGFGVYRFYTGDMYVGEWFKGQCHGCGVHTCEDGSRYFGEFKGGVKHGLGHYHFRNGDTYAGEYFADKMHGFGVYRFANGHVYDGAWHEGRRQGFGLYTFRNGDTQSGHWENGVLSVSSTQDTLPGSSMAVTHAKVLKAVQEARRIAEKAVVVANVDERVNRAVTAANRAANAARVAAVKAVQNRMHQNNDNVNYNDDLPLSIV